MLKLLMPQQQHLQWRCGVQKKLSYFRAHSSSSQIRSSHHGSVRQGSSRVALEQSHDWEKILDRPWLLPSVATKVKEVHLENKNDWGPDLQSQGCSFHVIQDDLLHPLMGGNKLRKLDALVPLFQAHGATDVVTCGGCQSAHTAAVAVACAEVGIKAHLLLRGERPAIPTGYNLVSGMYGHVTYIPRAEYADRQAMLQKHAIRVAGDPTCIISMQDHLISLTPGNSGGDNKKRVVILNEGAGDCFAVLGLIRLVEYLSQPTIFGKEDCLRIVVDCGTGTTAVGLALGIALYGLSWQVVGVMLADNQEGYERHADRLLTEFAQHFHTYFRGDITQKSSSLQISWQTRHLPRKFGRILPGEVEKCQQVARETGVLLDPIYTLAGWEAAHELCKSTRKDVGQVALLHTGGTLGLFGLAQRYPLQF